MIRTLAIAFLLAVVACGERTPPPETAEQAVNLDSLEDAIEAEAEELAPMPDYPGDSDGQLNVRAVGAFELDRGWAAKAGRCATPAMVLVIAEEPGSGASILLQLPPSAELTGRYPVKLADSAGMPAPRASQLGLQFFETSTADAYQASEGEVEVRELTDRRVSGRFAVTVRHLVNNRHARVAGTFHHVAVEALPPDWCEQAAAAQDSLAVATDSTEGEG